ncbi:MAG: class I SAM-dependent methyltransferase [Chitinophagaceae bacterium]|nr:class I SAM-dependent methyltransferase [Chitinophagaceae bacterium]
MLNFFYIIINRGYKLVFGNNYMLHAPLFLKVDDTLFDAQCHFSAHCLSFLPSLRGKRILDIGCGNGMLARYILKTYDPSFIYGVDIVAHQIDIAKINIEKDQEGRILFAVDDAQLLSTVGNQQFDIVICIESALHYPDKNRFLSQVKRVLAPGRIFSYSGSP